MKTGSASSSVDDLFKSLAGRRLESLCKGKKMRAAAWNLWTSNRIDPNPNGIDCYHEQGQVLKTAGASNPDARVGTQSSAECSDTKKEQDFISYKGLAFGNNLSPSRIGTRRKPLCLSTRARYHLSQSFPSVDDITDQGSPGPMWCQVVPSCAKLCQVAQILLQRPFEGISIRESCSLNHGALPHVSHDMGSVGKSIQSQCTNTKQLQMSRNVQAWGAESLPIDGSCECEFTWCLSCSLLDILEILDVEGDGTGT